MKGLILAGGTGTRLWPITRVLSKQLLPIYDKPLIYYPLSTLMLAGIQEVLIITTLGDSKIYRDLLGDGAVIGMKISYAIQERPEGLAQALIIGETFLGQDKFAMILGDNFFYGAGLPSILETSKEFNGAQIFVYEVSNPKDYGVLALGIDGKPESVIEKPISTKSKLAITGLYFFDSNSIKYAKEATPSDRGELEITYVINQYLNEGTLNFTRLSRGTAWLDTGNPNSLHDAASFVRIIEERTGSKIGCIEEIAWRKKWITNKKLLEIIDTFGNSEYGKYLSRLVINNE